MNIKNFFIDFRFTMSYICQNGLDFSAPQLEVLMIVWFNPVKQLKK